MSPISSYFRNLISCVFVSYYEDTPPSSFSWIPLALLSDRQTTNVSCSLTFAVRAVYNAIIIGRGAATEAFLLFKTFQHKAPVLAWPSSFWVSAAVGVTPGSTGPLWFIKPCTCVPNLRKGRLPCASDCLFPRKFTSTLWALKQRGPLVVDTKILPEAKGSVVSHPHNLIQLINLSISSPGAIAEWFKALNLLKSPVKFDKQCQKATGTLHQKCIVEVFQRFLPGPPFFFLSSLFSSHSQTQSGTTKESSFSSLTRHWQVHLSLTPSQAKLRKDCRGGQEDVCSG